MAFQNVDVGAIQTSLAKIKEDLNVSKEKISSLPEGLSDTENWKCETGTKILQKLLKFPERIQQIIGKIEICEAVVAKIGEYKAIEAKRNEKAEEMSGLQADYNRMSATYLGTGGTLLPTPGYDDLGRRIDALSEEISKLEGQMAALEQEINGMGV